MKYLAVLGRQPEISIAELEAVYGSAQQISDNLAVITTEEKAFAPGIARSKPSAHKLANSPDEGFFATTGANDRELAHDDGPSDRCPSGTIRQLDTSSGSRPAQNIDRLGGTLKLAVELEQKPLDYLSNLPEGKITLGVSDYSKNASRKSAQLEALKLKRILVRHGRSVRMVESHDAVLSTATSLHNGLSGKNPRKVELIKTGNGWYRVIGVQDIEAYARRDQKRPARDAKVGMLPPKLAQILINLCGPLRPGSVILDPFCGTGVVLQEALLMGYRAYGTDINERMVEYSEKNLKWLLGSGLVLAQAGPAQGKLSRRKLANSPDEGFFATTGANDRELARNDGPSDRCPSGTVRQLDASSAAGPVKRQIFHVSQGDATSFQWTPPIDAVACEGYLGKPMSNIPTDIELKKQQQECQSIILGFLKNLASQITSGTPVVIAIPAWLRQDGSYERLKILDFLGDLGYNVDNKVREGLIYARTEQVVARDIIILRKK